MFQQLHPASSKLRRSFLQHLGFPPSRLSFGAILEMIPLEKALSSRKHRSLGIGISRFQASHDDWMELLGIDKPSLYGVYSLWINGFSETHKIMGFLSRPTARRVWGPARLNHKKTVCSFEWGSNRIPKMLFWVVSTENHGHESSTRRLPGFLKVRSRRIEVSLASFWSV